MKRLCFAAFVVMALSFSACAPKTCGSVDCAAGTVCCNASCGTCIAPDAGAACTLELCAQK